MDRPSSNRHGGGGEVPFEALAEGAPIALALLKGPDLALMWSNAAFAEVLGDHVDLHRAALSLPSALRVAGDPVAAALLESAADGAQGEVLGGLADGHRAFRWTARQLDDRSGRVLTTVVDVTDRLESEREARVLADRSRAVTASARDIVLLVHEDGTIVYANQAAEKAYGRSSQELIGLRLLDLRAPETHASVGAQMQAAKQGGLLFETTHVRADGTTFPVEVSARGVVIGGEPALLSIIRDISVRRAREQERDRLVDDLKRSNEVLDGVLRLISGAMRTLELDELFREAIADVRAVMAADAALFFVRDGDVLAVAAQVGADDFTPVGWSVPLGEGFAGRVAAGGVPFFESHVADKSTAIQVHKDFGVDCMFGVPMFLDGELFGVLECAWRTPREVTEVEHTMLQVASERLMSAIANARLYRRTKRSEHLGKAINNVSGIMNSSFDLASVMTEALEAAAAGIDCDAAVLGSTRDSVTRVEYAHGIAPGTEFISLGDHDALVQPDGEPRAVVLEDSEPSDALLGSLALREAVAMPLLVRGELTGTLILGRARSAQGFDDVDLGYVRRVAGVMSLAFANIRDFEAEHRIAETLQEALLTLPAEVPGVRFGSLYQSATVRTRVGGDFYDLFALPGGRVGVIIGDVSGKGLEAAVTTSLIKDTIRAYAHDTTSPAEAVGKANRVMCSIADRPSFASVAFVILDPQTGEAAYCCAGHPPVMIIRRDGRIEELDVGSPVIGAFDTMTYTEHSFTIGPEDVLVLYTDGVTEARRPDGEFFADEGLRRTLAALVSHQVETLPAAIFDDVMRFTEGRLSDDVALLAVRRA